MSDVASSTPATGVSATSAPMGSPPTREGAPPPRNTNQRAGAESGATTQAPADEAGAPKKFTFKGLKDGDKTFDFEGDETALKNELMKARAANRRFEEAAKERKELEKHWRHVQTEKQKSEHFKKTLAEDPIKAAELMGVDVTQVEKAFEARLLKQIQREQATEEQRALMEAQERAERAEKIAQDFQRQRQQEIEGKKLTQNKDLIQTAIIKALNASNLPKNEFMVKRMAQALKASVSRGLGLDVNYAREIVLEGLGNDVQHYVGSYAKTILEAHKAGDIQTQLRTLESLEQAIGKEAILAIRRADITRLRHGQPKGPTNPLSRPPETIPEKSQDEKGAYEFDTVEEEREHYQQRAQKLQKEWELRQQTAR